MLKKNKLQESKPLYKVNWYEDKYQSVLVWRNWLFVITLASLLGITAVCGVLYTMLPLKSVAPFVIQVDEKSGLSEVVTSKTLQEYSANEMLIKYFSMVYIAARENYSPDILKSNAEIVRLMSSADVTRTYTLFISADNPDGPLMKYNTRLTRFVDLLSFSVISKNEATGESIVQVRIKSNEYGFGSNADGEYAVVTMSVHFEKELDLNEKERLINPLGFVVTSYKADAEIQGQGSATK